MEYVNKLLKSIYGEDFRKIKPYVKAKENKLILKKKIIKKELETDEKNVFPPINNLPTDENIKQEPRDSEFQSARAFDSKMPITYPDLEPFNVEELLKQSQEYQHLQNEQIEQMQQDIRGKDIFIRELEELLNLVLIKLQQTTEENLPLIKQKDEELDKLKNEIDKLQEEVKIKSEKKRKSAKQKEELIKDKQLLDELNNRIQAVEKEKQDMLYAKEQTDLLNKLRVDVLTGKIGKKKVKIQNLKVMANEQLALLNHYLEKEKQDRLSDIDKFNKHEKEKAEVMKQLSEKKKQINQSEKLTQEQKDHINQLQLQIQGLQGLNMTLKLLNEQKILLDQKKLDSFQTKYNKLMSEYTGVESKKGSLEKQITALQKDINKMMDDKSKMDLAIKLTASTKQREMLIYQNNLNELIIHNQEKLKQKQALLLDISNALIRLNNLNKQGVQQQNQTLLLLQQEKQTNAQLVTDLQNIQHKYLMLMIDQLNMKDNENLLHAAINNQKMLLNQITQQKDKKIGDLLEQLKNNQVLIKDAFIDYQDDAENVYPNAMNNINQPTNYQFQNVNDNFDNMNNVFNGGNYKSPLHFLQAVNLFQQSINNLHIRQVYSGEASDDLNLNVKKQLFPAIDLQQQQLQKKKETKFILAESTGMDNFLATINLLKPQPIQESVVIGGMELINLAYQQQQQLKQPELKQPSGGMGNFMNKFNLALQQLQQLKQPELKQPLQQQLNPLLLEEQKQQVLLPPQNLFNQDSITITDYVSKVLDRFNKKYEQNITTKQFGRKANAVFANTTRSPEKVAYDEKDPKYKAMVLFDYLEYYPHDLNDKIQNKIKKFINKTKMSNPNFLQFIIDKNIQLGIKPNGSFK